MSSESIQRKLQDVKDKIAVMENERTKHRDRDQAAVDGARRHLEGAQARADDDPQKAVEIKSFTGEIERYEQQLRSDEDSYEVRIKQLRDEQQRLERDYAEASAKEDQDRKAQAAATAINVLKDATDR